MSTQAMIGRFVDSKIEGRYHHFDGYPTGLGKELFKLAKEWGKERLMKVLIDDHPAGWSSILEADWNLPPRHQKDLKCANCGRPRYAHMGALRSEGSFPPECYCHGDSQEDPSLLTDPSQMEWAYIFMGHMMYVRRHGNLVEAVDLEGPEPNWQEIQDRVYNS